MSRCRLTEKSVLQRWRLACQSPRRHRNPRRRPSRTHHCHSVGRPDSLETDGPELRRRLVHMPIHQAILLLLPSAFCKRIFSGTHILIFDWRPQYSTCTSLCTSLKNSTTFAELKDCTPPNYTFLSTPRTSSSKGNSSAVVGGGTCFLIREPFTQPVSYTHLTLPTNREV